MERSEIKELLAKLMSAFADDDEPAEGTDSPEEEASEEAAAEISEELTEEANEEAPEEEAEKEEEEAKEDEKDALTDEMKALIRAEVGRLFKEMAQPGNRESKETDKETASALNKIHGIYGPNN